MTKDRLAELDIMRGIAFILVVIQHTFGGYSFIKDISLENRLISKLIYSIGKTAVPMFVALTAICLIYVYYDRMDVLNFYIKKLKFLILPYIFCSLINDLILNHSTYGFTNFIGQIVTGNSAYHLWYMGMIIRLYLYIPLIFLFIKKLNSTSTFIKKSFFIFSFVLYYLILKNNNYVTSTIGKLLFGTPSKLQQSFINITPLLWIFYFVVGAYMIFNYTNLKVMIKKYKYALIGGYTILLSYFYYDDIKDFIGNPLPFIKFDHALYIVYVTTAIIFFYMLSLYIDTVSKKISILLSFVGKYSFPAYMLHIIVIQKWSEKIPSTHYLYSPLIKLLVTIIITPIICCAISYIPGSKYLIGIRSKFKIKSTVVQKLKINVNR
ncbi:acyltransferase family protein [Clostridium ragsdalei P11]|uniref:Acyltransferase family protein n=1 Tax=Clostridium ragsdalei P11 TaxID=1353534 RepID=A0A1A6AUM3_9CLOT|nr:acyltransferase [Clostridium ragsdalei]OBR93738.1 acyltransferase family protein [Clostridium ragsdalei P11]